MNYHEPSTAHLEWNVKRHIRLMISLSGCFGLMNERRPSGYKIPILFYHKKAISWHYINENYMKIDFTSPLNHLIQSSRSEKWLPCRWWAAPRGCGLPVAAPARWAAPGPSRRRGSRCLPLWPWAIRRRWRRTSLLSLFSPGRTCSWFAWGRRERSHRGTTAPSALWRHRG